MFSLLLYWLCIFHGLRQTERGAFSFYLPKVMLVGTMWISATGVAYFEKKAELRDPSFSYQVCMCSTKFSFTPPPKKNRFLINFVSI